MGHLTKMNIKQQPKVDQDFITVSVVINGGRRDTWGAGAGAALPEGGPVHLIKQMASRGRNMMWKY